eukprot:6651021-Ditylum_brightwellii.AAC.1
MKCNKDTFPRQRFAPTVNCDGSQEKVISSVQLMAQLHHALMSVQNFENNEMFYFSRSIAIMSNSKDGVYH